MQSLAEFILIFLILKHDKSEGHLASSVNIKQTIGDLKFTTVIIGLYKDIPERDKIVLIHS